jgi:phage terminase large subunit GpA-like protein
MTLSDPPPWAFEVCPECGCDVLLQAHDLSCPQFDSRPRAAVAWICEHCDHVLHTVGLFTDWATAIYARNAELDLRAARYFAELPGDAHDDITTESRRRGIN